MELFILILEIVGTVSFALSGAMTGLKKNMDIFGVCVLGVTTAVGGGILRDVSVDSAGNVALLLASGQVCQLVTLDKELNVQYSGNVTTSNKVVRRGELVDLLTDSTVESLTSAGEYQWSQSLTARPQALLADAKQTLVFCGNTVQQVTAPETSQAS